jgi:hypothetical protein
MVPEGTGILRFPPSRLFPLKIKGPRSDYWDRLLQERDLIQSFALKAVIC